MRTNQPPPLSHERNVCISRGAAKDTQNKYPQHQIYRARPTLPLLLPPPSHSNRFATVKMQPHVFTERLLIIISPGDGWANERAAAVPGRGGRPRRRAVREGHPPPAGSSGDGPRQDSRLHTPSSGTDSAITF